MRKVLRQIIFINTSPPDERVEFLKPIEDIKEMDDDSKKNMYHWVTSEIL